MEVVRNKIDSSAIQKLVERFQDVSAPQREKNIAFVHITNYFRKEVLEKCEIICKRFRYGVGTAELIAQKTFESYARKGKFDLNKAKTGNSYEESFLLYLFKIAEHELIDYYRDIERKKNNPYNGAELVYSELPEVAINRLTAEQIIEFEILKNLSKTKRSIYLTYTAHQRQHFKMPRDLLKKLREVCGGINQKTVNSYLKEVKDEIKRAKEAYRKTISN